MSPEKFLFQVFQNKRAVYGDLPQRRTSIHLPAVCTGIQSLFPDTIMYGAELITEGRFCTLYAAADAVYHFRRNRYHIEFCPQDSSFFTHGIVVCERCDTGIAFFAVQPAAANQLIYIFHSFYHSFRFAQGTNKWDIEPGLLSLVINHVYSVAGFHNWLIENNCYHVCMESTGKY